MLFPVRTESRCVMCSWRGGEAHVGLRIPCVHPVDVVIGLCFCEQGSGGVSRPSILVEDLPEFLAPQCAGSWGERRVKLLERDGDGEVWSSRRSRVRKVPGGVHRILNDRVGPLIEEVRLPAVHPDVGKVPEASVKLETLSDGAIRRRFSLSSGSVSRRANTAFPDQERSCAEFACDPDKILDVQFRQPWVGVAIET